MEKKVVKQYHFFYFQFRGCLSSLGFLKNFFFWKEGWWGRKLALPSEEICNSTKILLFNAYLNLGCLHLLVLITELHFWSIDNQYSCCSKTSEFYKINLWLELAPWKAEIYRKRRLNHDTMLVVLVLERR